jgi:ribosome-associated heat shock protein Hsp15
VSNDALRLDRWLWFTRFYKTRVAASEAVRGGHVRVNGERARASCKVSVGDRIELTRQRLGYDLTVVSVPTRRGPAREAQACYDEAPDSVARRELKLANLKSDRLQMPLTKGRPDKHTRRKLRERNRGSQ